MNNDKRRRINISVDDALYKKLQHIKKAYGFKNVCEFNTALLTLLCQYIDAAEERGPMNMTYSDSEIITYMFNDFGNWEHTPDGIIPVRHKNSNANSNGKG